MKEKADAGGRREEGRKEDGEEKMNSVSPLRER